MPRPSSFRALATALAVLALPCSLRAQASEGVPFEAGRWAIEVSSQQELGSLGFLRFVSPNSAWIVAPGIVIGTADATQSDPFGEDVEAELSTLGVDLRVGYRRYQSLGRGVVSHLGAGVLGQSTRTEEDYGDGTSSETTTTSFGAYGELGGSYFFTPRFGLGASATASLTRDHVEDDAFGHVEIDGWTFAMPQARLLVTVVF